MFIYIYRLYLSNKIAVCFNYLFQAAPDAAAGVDDVLPGDVAEYLHDGTDEGVLGVMGGPVGVSLSHAPYIKVQGIDIRAARRPYFLLPEVRQIGPAPILRPVGIVSRC